VKLSGSSGPEFFDNETALFEGDSVCIDGDSKLTTTACGPDNSLFDVQSLVAQSEISGLAIFNLGNDVDSAYAEGEFRELLQARLTGDALISFDGIQDGIPASCGEVVSPGESVNTCNLGAGDLGAAFAVSSDATEMWLLLTDAVVEGPLNAQGNISLADPGYYSVSRFAEGVAADGTAAPAPVEELMTIYIDVYESPEGGRESYARFERVSDSDFYQSDADDRQLRVSVPGYLHLRTVQGHDIDIDTRALLDDELRVSYFVFKQQQLAGTHDLNADGIIDIDVIFDNGLWVFRFDPTVEDVRDPSLPDEQPFPVDAAGFRVVTLDADLGYAEMMVRIEDTEYFVVTYFAADGFGMLEVVDQ